MHPLDFLDGDPEPGRSGFQIHAHDPTAGAADEP